jgi:hypothetical protein
MSDVTENSTEAFLLPRPCPFCGAAPIVRRNEFTRIWCANEECHAEVSVEHVMGSVAVERWNGRAQVRDDVGEAERRLREAQERQHAFELNIRLLKEVGVAAGELERLRQFVTQIANVQDIDDVDRLYIAGGAPDLINALYNHVMGEFFTVLKCAHSYQAYESDGCLKEAIAYEVRSLLGTAGVIDENHERVTVSREAAKPRREEVSEG